MNPELFVKCCTVANFVAKHYEPARKWKDPITIIQFFIAQGFCVTLYNGNELVGVLAARPVEKPEDGAVMHRFKRGSDCLFIDLLITPEGMPNGMGFFSRLLEQSFGTPKKLAYYRHENDQLVVRDYDGFAKKVRKERGT